jgi:hypothetical protein
MRKTVLSLVPILLASILQLPQPSQPTKSPGNQESHSTSIQDSSKDSKSPVDTAITTLSMQPAGDSRQNSSSERWMLVFTAVIASAAVVQAIIYGKQARLMREALAETKKAADAATNSANTAERALHLSERADILIDQVNGSDGELITGGTQITVKLRNCGKSKATDVNIGCYIIAIEHYRSGPQSGERPHGVRHGPPVVIAPAGEWEFQSGPLGHFIDDPIVINEINQGAKRLWIQVVVNYLDVFKTPPRLLVGSGLFYKRPDGKFIMTVETSD